MNISKKTSESIDTKINELVEQLEKENENAGIKLMNDNIFSVDIDTEYKSNFDVGKPKKKEEDNITYI